MRHATTFAIMSAIALAASAEIQIINGKKYECRDGMCMPVEEEYATPLEAAPSADGRGALVATADTAPRMKMGYMGVDEFLAFVNGGGDGVGSGEADASPFAGKAWWAIALLALFGGLCMNLTPCVLPMVPVNLMIIGRSASRGALYGLGIALAYGAMGLLAAFGGMAFGEVQGNPWFNAAMAALFLLLALSLMGVFFIDFSKRRNGLVFLQSGMLPGLFAFFMGVVGAVLAGACVAPVLVGVLLLTADLAAKGHAAAFALPFVLGVGMALPWPFAGAGMKVLPKPGAWMAKVNKAFGVAVLAFAAWYAYLSYNGFASRGGGASAASGEGVVSFASPSEFNVGGLPRPILVDCWATWCKNCSAMERTTLSDPKVKEALKDFTVVRVDCEDMAELRRNPVFDGVIGLPAFLVFE